MLGVPSVLALARPGRRRRLPPEGSAGAAGGDAQRHAEPRQGAARQPDRHHLQVRRRQRREVRPGLPRDGPRRRHRRRADVDRRSRSAGADHAVEAGADGRVHAHGVRPDLSVRRRGDDSGRAVFDREPEAVAAQRRGRRAARVQGRAAAAAAADRERVHGVQGRLASGRNAPSTTRRSSGSGRRKRRRSPSRTRRRTASSISTSTTPAASSTSRSRCTVSTGRTAARSVHADARKPAMLRKIPLPAAAAGRRPTWPSCGFRSTRRSCRHGQSGRPTKDPRELGVRVFHAVVVDPAR